MDLSGSYTSSFRLVRINTETWADELVLPGVSSAQIERNMTDEYPLLESGNYTMVWDSGEEFPNRWYRLEMLVTDAYGQHERYEIATQRLMASQGAINRGASSLTLSGQSVLHPLSKRQMPVGRHVPKGVNGVEWVLDLFDATVAPVIVDGSGFKVDEHYVFDPGTTYLRAVWDVLRLGDWCMQVDGHGIITLKPKPQTPSISLDKTTRSLLLPGINYQYDISDVPNHYVAIASDGSMSEVYNQNYPGSNTSVAAREGLVQDYVDTAPVPINGEGMYGYVRRRLEEESTVVRQYSYTRGYVDDVYPFDIVSAILPLEGIVGDLRVMSQSLACGRGITVTETSGEEIKEYA